MRLNLADAPPGRDAPEPPGPGSLFRTTHGTFYLLIALIPTGGSGMRAHCVHFDKDGQPTGVKLFGASYLENLARVGDVPDLLTVEWLQ
jgi:hypothetical protein